MVPPRLAGNVVRLLLIVLCAGAPARGEAPDVKFLFPSGLQQGTSRTLKVNGKPGTLPVDAWTSDERLSGRPDEKGETIELTAAKDIPPGVHWLRLFNVEGASELLPIVVGVIPEVTEEQLTDNENPQPLVLPTTISGVLSKSGQVDSYDVDVEEGQTLIASIDSRRLLDSPADIVLQLASEQGFVVAQNHDHHDVDPQIVYTIPADGAYTVRVFAFPADPNQTIRFAGGDNYVYRLTLTTGPFVDHLFPPALPSQRETALQELGWNLPVNSSPIVVSSTSSDAIPVLAHPGSFLMNRLQRIEVPLVTEPALSDRTKSNVILAPSAACGHIAVPGERDTWQFPAKKGETLRLSVAAQGFDSPLDPVLEIRDAQGKFIKAADDIAKGNADVRVEVKVPADGEYTAEVTDRYGHGGMRYVYLLSIEQPRPTYRLSLEKTRLSVSVEKPLEIPVAVDRQEGFDGAISVEIAGLPEGVRAETVESAPKGDTAKKVTLKVEATGEAAFNGPIRVIGTSGDEPAVTATADAPVAGLTIDEIWLTVVAAEEKDDKAEESTSD